MIRRQPTSKLLPYTPLLRSIPKGMRIKAGSTVFLPKVGSRAGDVSSAMADHASLSLEKPPPPASKCPKPAKGAKNAKAVKCGPAKPNNATPSVASKGNSSQKNAASQHKSASTGLAKSAKNGSSTPASNSSSNKGASKNP